MGRDPHRTHRGGRPERTGTGRERASLHERDLDLHGLARTHPVAPPGGHLAAADLGDVGAQEHLPVHGVGLEELAPTYDLNRLPQRRDTELLLGVVDDPDHQDQHPEYFRPDDEGHIAFYGASGSGKSTALRSLAIAAAITPRSGPVDVYALDAAGGGLAMLESLPHVGAVVEADDDERVTRLLRYLTDLIDTRSERYAAARAATITDYRRISGNQEEPRILLLVDGIGSFRTEYEKNSDGLAVLDLFQRILVDGRGVGVHVAAGAERPQAISTSMAGTFQRKVVLRQTDEEGYMYFNLPKDVLSPKSPPGRAMQVDRKDEELQLAILGDNVNVLAQSRLVESFGHYLERRGRTRPTGVGKLPDELSTSALPETVAGLPTLGMSSDTLGPWGYTPVGASSSSQGLRGEGIRADSEAALIVATTLSMSWGTDSVETSTRATCQGRGIPKVISSTPTGAVDTSEVVRAPG